MPRPTPVLDVSEDQQKQIEQWLGALGTPQQVALRGRIVLAAGHGKSEAAICAEMNVNRKTVRLWRDRFAAQGLPGLWEIAPGRGRKATYKPERIKAVIDATLQSKPKGMTHWSCRLMAAHEGISKSTKPFVWTATLDSIVAKLARCRQTLEQIQPGCTAPKTRKRKSS